MITIRDLRSASGHSASGSKGCKKAADAMDGHGARLASKIEQSFDAQQILAVRVHKPSNRLLERLRIEGTLEPETCGADALIMLVMVMVLMTICTGPERGAIDRFEQPARIHRAVVCDNERRKGIKRGEAFSKPRDSVRR